MPFFSVSFDRSPSIQNILHQCINKIVNFCHNIHTSNPSLSHSLITFLVFCILLYRSQYTSHQGTTIDSIINEQLDHQSLHVVHHGGCNCCCRYYGPDAPAMQGQLTLRTPLHDARRRSLDQSNEISVFGGYTNRLVNAPNGYHSGSDQRLFRKNNLISYTSDSEMWKNNKNRVASVQGNVRIENLWFGSQPALNCVDAEPKPEDRSFSRKNANRKVGRVSPFVAAPRVEEEVEEEDLEEEENHNVKHRQVENNLSAELEQQAYLVLGMNSQARRPFKRKICTPFNKRITMPPEHFKVSEPQKDTWVE